MTGSRATSRLHAESVSAEAGTEDTHHAETAQQASQDDSEGESNALLYGVIALAVAAVIIVAVYMMKKGK